MEKEKIWAHTRARRESRKKQDEGQKGLICLERSTGGAGEIRLSERRGKAHLPQADWKTFYR